MPLPYLLNVAKDATWIFFNVVEDIMQKSTSRGGCPLLKKVVPSFGVAKVSNERFWCFSSIMVWRPLLFKKVVKLAGEVSYKSLWSFLSIEPNIHEMYLLNKNLKLLDGVLWSNNSFWFLHLAFLFLINQEQHLIHNIITLMLVFSKPIVQFLEEFGTYFFSRIRVLCDLFETNSNHGSFSHEDVNWSDCCFLKPCSPNKLFLEYY